MIKEVKGNTKLEHYGDSFIARIPDNIIDLLVLENNQTEIGVVTGALGQSWYQIKLMGL